MPTNSRLNAGQKNLRTGRMRQPLPFFALRDKLDPISRFANFGTARRGKVPAKLFQTEQPRILAACKIISRTYKQA